MVMQGTTVHGHALRVHSAFYTPVDAESIPTGAIEPVSGTAFDFTEAKLLDTALQALPDGVDHNFVLSEQEKDLRGSVMAPGALLQCTCSYLWPA